MSQIDIDAVLFRNTEHDCTVNRRIITVAQGYEESESPFINQAVVIYLSEYNPTQYQRMGRAYFAPHIPGKPGHKLVEYLPIT